MISQELFDIVQTTLKKNSGRSETLQPKPEREYLLKGIIRCAYCGMPMWAQTYKSGQTYYREHKASRSHDVCPASGGSIPCHVADDQISKLVEAIELGPQWLEEVLAIISLKDEVERVKKERQAVQEKLRRMAKAYVDGLFPDEEYHRQKKLLEMELESLVVPAANAAEEAGKLIMNLPDSGLRPTWKSEEAAADHAGCGLFRCQEDQVDRRHKTEAALQPDLPGGGDSEKGRVFVSLNEP